jgi:hypothetical protein
MDDWKKVVRWAARERAQGRASESRAKRDHLKRMLKLSPLIAGATIPFGWLAFTTLDPTTATVRTVGVFLVAVILAELTT